MPRKRKEKPEEQPVAQMEEQPLQIDATLLNDPDRMQYALLLALLVKNNGTVRLTAKDLERADDDFNVIFSVTASGKALEVTAVPPQSGILRSPQKRKAEAPRLEEPLAFQPLPRVPADWDNPTPEEMASVARILETRQSSKTESPKIVFPFETGNRPEDTRPLTLNDSANRLLQRDAQIAAEQAEAIARQEAES